MSSDLSVVFTGIRFPNPFLLSSAPPTESDSNIMRAFDAGWGGVVTKTIGGRTGDTWFGIERWGVEPDIMTSAKGMANGSPIGWTIARPEIAGAYPGLTFSTFGGKPVTSAAALATIRVIEENELPKKAAIVGRYLRDKLEELKAKYEVIGDVHGMGLMQAIECVTDRASKTPNAAAVMRVFEETKRRGVLIGKGGLNGNVIRLGPPLIASLPDIDVLVEALDGAFASLKK